MARGLLDVEQAPDCRYTDLYGDKHGHRDPRHPESYGTRLDLRTQYDNFIDGKWQAPADGEYFDNVTPVTGQVLTRNARSKERDIELALDAAHRAAPKWGATPPPNARRS